MVVVIQIPRKSSYFSIPSTSKLVQEKTIKNLLLLIILKEANPSYKNIYKREGKGEPLYSEFRGKTAPLRLLLLLVVSDDNNLIRF